MSLQSLLPSPVYPFEQVQTAVPELSSQVASAWHAVSAQVFGASTSDATPSVLPASAASSVPASDWTAGASSWVLASGPG
jgi:hypothetical protein